MRNLLFATLTLLSVVFFASCTKNSLIDTATTPTTVTTTPDTTHTDGDSTDVDGDHDGDHNDGDSTDVHGGNGGDHNDSDSTDVDGNDGDHGMDGDSTDVDGDGDHNDGDSTDVNGNGNDQIPSVVQSWLNTNLPGAEVKDFKFETLCDGTNIIEVEVKQGSVKSELEFSSDGSLLYTEVETPFADLPAAVKSAITTLFPNGDIDEDATLLQASVGANRYEVKVKDGNTEWEVMVGADGTVICKKEE
jgi:hypothetical protein